MRREIKQLSYALLAAGVVVLIFLTIAAWPFFEFVIYDGVYTRKQMYAGKKYMDSLTDKDIQAWIQRTQVYLRNLKEYSPTDLLDDQIPPDLRKLGILGIEEDTNIVEYVWLGGMDNTRLCVERMSDGNYQVTAIYTPYSSKVIWPKQ